MLVGVVDGGVVFGLDGVDVGVGVSDVLVDVVGLDSVVREVVCREDVVGSAVDDSSVTVLVGVCVVDGSDSDVAAADGLVLDTGAAGADGLFGLSSQTASATRPTTTIPPMIAGRFQAPGFSSSSSAGLVCGRGRGGGGGAGSSS